ncbi:hypothetical protein [Legionella worsleiensis]|uniref:Uncharacterized protein n=1 Tax=Legionella worsleiensis TaxID=45076 RepID=A0A0W1AEH4_9GAMM|nr:hypothetical protein [Legionella worsleiensis]KTD79733.1 hypothetical protein Lwor_1247 [Legionella worsleiensis]STY32244.1 Uncharacterised protein [Legionella worsleiensis]
MNNATLLMWAGAAALVVGLSGCHMDGQSAQESTYSTEYSTHVDKSAAVVSAPKQKSYASKEPTQESTPGPKQTAAPQLPVIE